MKKYFFLLAFVFSSTVSAEFVPRCGTDAFGNEVCLDKDGRLTGVPKAAAGSGASGVSAAGPEPGRDDAKKKERCGIDPFGNMVCSQKF
ncbi:MAG: hypothetical protein PHQ60_12510 [Sideroxydans sp.]|nr:hypothetical protein [Sideroxydans sp.]